MWDMWGLRVDLHIYFYRFHVRVPTVIAMTQRKTKKLCVILLLLRIGWYVCECLSKMKLIIIQNFDPVLNDSRAHARTRARASPSKNLFIFRSFFLRCFVCLCKRMRTNVIDSRTQFVIHLYDFGLSEMDDRINSTRRAATKICHKDFRCKILFYRIFFINLTMRAESLSISSLNSK